MSAGKRMKPYRSRKQFKLKRGGGRYLLGGDGRAKIGMQANPKDFLSLFAGLAPGAFMARARGMMGRRSEGQGR